MVKFIKNYLDFFPAYWGAPLCLSILVSFLFLHAIVPFWLLLAWSLSLSQLLYLSIQFYIQDTQIKGHTADQSAKTLVIITGIAASITYTISMFL